MINVAILGVGFGRSHLAAYRNLKDNFTVSIIVARNPMRVESIRQEGDNFDVLDDIDDALEDSDVDVIDICLPPHMHADVTKRALQAGKHVICEKPLAMSMSDVDEIRQVALATDRKVYPVFQFRWEPSILELRRDIESGMTGQLQVATLETHWSRGPDYYDKSWRGECGAVLNHAIHNHDILTHIAGKVARVSAFTTTRVNDIETEDCASINFDMASGALVTSSITLGAANNQTRIKFVFEKLTRELDIRPSTDGLEGFLNNVALDLTGHENQAVTLEDGALSISLATAIYHSARTGSQVLLPRDN